jgi:exosortase/archaeosortase family protein
MVGATGVLRLKHLNRRFVFILLLYGAVVFFVYRDEVLASLLAPLAEATALITSKLISQFGIETLRQGSVLIHPDGFAYEIAYTCTGLLPVVTFIVCVLAYSGTLRNKWRGIVIGVPVLLIVNYLRLAHLFYIGVYFPSAFRLAHEVIWEGLLAVSFIGLWCSWISWSNNCQSEILNR